MQIRAEESVAGGMAGIRLSAEAAINKAVAKYGFTLDGKIEVDSRDSRYGCMSEHLKRFKYDEDGKIVE